MRFLKRALIVLLSVTIGGFLLLSLLLSAFADGIGRRVVDSINEQLTTELRVQDFDMSLLRYFPNASVVLRGVVVLDTREDELLAADAMSFRLGLLDLFRGQVNLKSVLVNDGALHIAIDRDGHANYDIFQPAAAEESAAAESELAINLADAKLENIQLNYRDASTDVAAQLQVEVARFRGNFGAAEYILDSAADLEIAYVDVAGTRYLAGRPLNYRLSTRVDNATDTYFIEEALLQLQDLEATIQGEFQFRAGGTHYNLKLSSNEGNLASALALVPEPYSQQLADIESSGIFQLDGQVAGLYAANQNPRIDLQLAFRDGELGYPKMDGEIDDLSFRAVYTNGAEQTDRTTRFALQDFRGYFQRERVELDLSIENLDNPFIDFYANGAIPVGILRGLAANDRITATSGEIKVSELRIRGSYEDFLRPERGNRIQSGGSLVFDDATVEIGGEALTLDRGQVRIIENRLLVENLDFTGPDTELTFSGEARNILPVYFADSLNSQNVQLQFQAELTGAALDIDRLLDLFQPTEEEIAAAAQTTGGADSLEVATVAQRELLSSFLDGTFEAAIETFNYGKITGEQFRGLLTLRNQELNIRGETQAMDGRFEIDGTYYARREPYLEARLTADRINIREFFEQGENFGQDFLRAEHLSGSTDARIFIQAYFDTLGNFQTDRLRVLAALGIQDGVLADFEMLESFSTYVNIQDLRQIRFTDLQNFIAIEDGKVILPVMFIQSNALNLTISGEHSFEQDIDYSIKVNAGQVLASRFQRHDPSLSPRPARRNGFFNLYYTITGNIDDYQVESAKREVKTDFEQSDLQRRRIRAELEQIFGPIDLVREPTEWQDIPEYPEDPDDDSEEFLDFEVSGGSGGRSGGGF
jgi:hypothetical protein